MRYRTVALALASALAITSCTAGGSAPAATGGRPASGAAATRPAAAQVTQPASAGSGPCGVTQAAMTKAIGDLDVYAFGPFGVALGATDPGNSAGFVGNPAFAVMTRSEASIAASMAAVASLLNTTLSKASGSAVGQAVIPYLDGTSGAYEDLTSGAGTMADEETIVVALSKAVAVALRACGPSPAVRYAPAQELAHDQMATLLGGAGNYDEVSAYNYANPGVAGYLSQMRGILEQEDKLQALGAQGDGGSCTVSEQMYNLAAEVLGSESGFEQDLSSGSDFGSALQEAQNLQATIDRITSEGLTPPAGAAETVTRTEQGISAGVATTNDEISAENALADKAYAMANAMAAIPAADTGQNGSYFGSCKPASWPVQPPPPIPDISE
jgi:hypothetical protein